MIHERTALLFTKQVRHFLRKLDFLFISSLKSKGLISLQVTGSQLSGFSLFTNYAKNVQAPSYSGQSLRHLFQRESGHQDKTIENDGGFPGGSDGKESACNAEDLDSIPGQGRSPGERNGNLLQCSYLKSSLDGGAWQSMGLQRVGHD